MTKVGYPNLLGAVDPYGGCGGLNQSVSCPHGEASEILHAHDVA